MQDLPFFYDYLNAEASAVQPGIVHSQNTILVRYFKRYLLDRAISVFRWGMPDFWIRPYVLYTVYCNGFTFVLPTKEFGVIPQHGGLMGRGVQYEPTNAVISNPLLPDVKEPRIWEDCGMLQLRPDYGGIMDLVSDYAEAMALTSELFSLNTLNSRLSYVFTARDKRSAETLKKAMDELYQGNPMTVVDKDVATPDGSPAWNLLLQNIGQNYVAGDVLENLRKLECKFDNEIGVPANLATAKKERTISAEVQANDAETYGRAAAWLELLQSCCKRINAMYDVGLSVDWRVDPLKPMREEVIAHAPNRTVDNVQ